MHQLEVEEEYCSNPVIYGSIWLDVGVTEHTFHILCIHLYDEVSDAHNVDMKSTKGAEEPIELDLWL
jgi:hypothetical protein